MRDGPCFRSGGGGTVQPALEPGVPLSGSPVNRIHVGQAYRPEGVTMANVLLLAGPQSQWALGQAKPAGLVVGLWYGLIMPIAFVVSLFSPGVRIYAPVNTGLAYDFGFMFGASSSLGGGAFDLSGSSTSGCRGHRSAPPAEPQQRHAGSQEGCRT